MARKLRRADGKRSRPKQGASPEAPASAREGRFTVEAPFGTLLVVEPQVALGRWQVSCKTAPPPEFLLADPNEQSFGYGGPSFFYADEEKVCRSCGLRFVFHAAEKKYWYETLKFDQSSTAIRCLSCRKSERALRQKQKEYQGFCKQTASADATAADWLGLSASLLFLSEHTGAGSLETGLAAARKARRLKAALDETWWLEAKYQQALGRPAKAKLAFDEYRRLANGSQAGVRARLREADALASITAELDPRVEAQLLEQVVRSPADDGPRAVYADSLTERGDLRGEFIALQLKHARSLGTAAEREREAALLAANGPRWLGPLTSWFVPGSVVYERGFLDACRVEVPTTGVEASLFEHPLWATVRTVECSDSRLLTSWALRSLEHGTLDADALAVLAERPTANRLRSVFGRLGPQGIRRGAALHDERAWRDVLQSDQFGSLTSLCVAPPEDDSLVAWFFRSRLAQQLERLDLGFDRPRVNWARWLNRVASMPKLTKLVLRQHAGFTARACLTLTRSRGGYDAVLELNTAPDAALRGGLVDSLAGLRREDVRSLRLETPSKVGAEGVVEALKRVVGRVSVVRPKDERIRAFAFDGKVRNR